jgi:hypothetical protein
MCSLHGPAGEPVTVKVQNSCQMESAFLRSQLHPNAIHNPPPHQKNARADAELNKDKKKVVKKKQCINMMSN